MIRIRHIHLRKTRILRRILASIASISMIIGAYILWVRPVQLKWGATFIEINRPMPGDEMHGNPSFLATRGITIEDTPENIWPWLIQMGYGRAGFYGYDIIENLGSSRGILSADVIIPEFQHFKVGDVVPISAVARLYFYAIEQYEYIVWAGDKGEYPGAFTWALYPIEKNKTRLVSRIGWSHHWTEPSLLPLDLFTEFSDHIAIREILQGVKGRVEGHFESFTRQTVEFSVYLSAFLIFIFAQIFHLFRPLSWRNWFANLFSGIVWLLTWYAPLPLWIGIILCVLAFFGLIYRSRQTVKTLLKT